MQILVNVNFWIKYLSTIISGFLKVFWLGNCSIYFSVTPTTIISAISPSRLPVNLFLLDMNTINVANKCHSKLKTINVSDNLPSALYTSSVIFPTILQGKFH